MNRSDLQPDLERFRLRRFIEALDATELERVTDASDLIDVARRLEGNTRAVLFERANGSDVPLVGNVMASRSRLALAFDTTPDQLVAEVLKRLRTPQPIVEVPREQAPVQQVVLTGDDADLTRLPANLQHIGAQRRTPCRKARISRRYDRHAPLFRRQDERAAGPAVAA
jgi:3-polyprenyl-4-hydroxybenzoate decarboxylase